MNQDHYDDLPYFDLAQNGYVQEIRRQDAYMKRGGKLSAPQQIKYDNRVSMLVERLLLIHEAVRDTPEDLRDYMESVEQMRRTGALPTQVYARFKDKLDAAGRDTQSTPSERDRDRFRVITGGATAETSSLSDESVERLIQMHEEKAISTQTLFEEFSKREKSGVKLPRMGGNLWGKYRGWVAEKRRNRRQPRNNEG
jgi:hypothetical protein